MKVHELIKLLQQCHPDWNVVIPIVNKVTIGASASIAIGGVFNGFDWDTGTVFINPVRDLKEK